MEGIATLEQLALVQDEMETSHEARQQMITNRCNFKSVKKAHLLDFFRNMFNAYNRLVNTSVPQSTIQKFSVKKRQQRRDVPSHILKAISCITYIT